MTTFGVAGVNVDFGSRRALTDVSLDAPGGRVTAVVGGDGAGKSTLLRCLVGLIEPAVGTVRRPPKTQIGYMPSTSGTWRELSVRENIEFVAHAYRLVGSQLAARSGQLLDRAGLSGASDRLAGQLSGGMRQKLGFCLAMLHDPELLVLDEPSTGVDAVSRIELWRLIAQAAAHGTAVVMATTYLEEGERAAHVLVLDRGRELVAGEPTAVLSSMEGSIVEVARPDAPDWAWRRGGTFHEWKPASAAMAGSTICPDLEDLVIVQMLRREHELGVAR